MKMRTFTNTVKMALLFIAMIQLSACSKDEEAPKKDKGQVEGNYAGVWTSSGDQLPERIRNQYSMTVLTLNENETYSWTWTELSGKTSTFKGTFNQEKTSFTHGSGSHLWKLQIKVTEINGVKLNGGWSGLYTYDSPNGLIVNIEPNITATYDFPSPEEGIGSGQSGTDGVHHFTKQ